MGGYGSSRWGCHWAKTTVEECLIVDAFDLARNGYFARPGMSGVWFWRRVNTGEISASVSYSVDADSLYDYVLWLTFNTGVGGERREIVEKIPVEATASKIGGTRWYFRCPLIKGGVPCYRRVQKLYHPPNEIYFGCRSCYDLTYRSCQESDKRLSFYRRNPVALLALLRNMGSGTGSSSLPSRLFLQVLMNAERWFGGTH